MLQGSLVRILSGYDSHPSSDFLDFGFGTGDGITGKLGLVLGTSKVAGLYDVYEVLLEDGSITSIEDLRLRKIGSNDKKDNEEAPTPSNNRPRL